MLTHLTDDAVGAVTITPIDKASLPAWREAHDQYASWLTANGFTAEPGSFVFLPATNGKEPSVLAAPNEGAAIWRWAGLPMRLPEGRYRLDARTSGPEASDAALGWSLGAYQFTRYKKPKRSPATLVWPDQADRAEVERLSHAVVFARDLISTPAEDMGPEELIAAGEAVGRAGGARVRIIRGDDLLRENYPTVHAVGRAAARQPGLLDFCWGDDNAPKVTVVGKGVCFDTGGLDLKTREGMLEMKKDMGGAAVVLTLAQALMSASAPIRLRVLVPAVENAVSGNAIRPLDIVRTRLGKTVEIGNTDAEGRLILCDALAAADEEAPDLIIDCATLTGAAKIALGPEIQALYCDDDEIGESLERMSRVVDDPLWRMPLWRGYRTLIDGKCADLNNVSTSPYAGSIIGALYLAEFVSAAKAWAHLDIMAANVKDRPGRPEGGEPTGMRALYQFIRNRFG
jgi:leucyl aminopeptidase